MCTKDEGAAVGKELGGGKLEVTKELIGPGKLEEGRSGGLGIVTTTDDNNSGGRDLAGPGAVVVCTKEDSSTGKELTGSGKLDVDASGKINALTGKVGGTSIVEELTVTGAGKGTLETVWPGTIVKGGKSLSTRVFLGVGETLAQANLML